MEQIVSGIISLSSSRLEVVLLLIFQGIVTGFAVAIGNYFANAHMIKRIEKLAKKIKGMIK